MYELIVCDSILYVISIGLLFTGKYFGGIIGYVIFWIFMVISFYFLVKIIIDTRQYFLNIFARCHKVPQEYIDGEIKKYSESKN